MNIKGWEKPRNIHIGIEKSKNIVGWNLIALAYASLPEYLQWAFLESHPYSLRFLLPLNLPLHVVCAMLQPFILHMAAPVESKKFLEVYNPFRMV